MATKKTADKPKSVKAQASKKSAVKKNSSSAGKKQPVYERQLTAEGWKRIINKIVNAE